MTDSCSSCGLCDNDAGINYVINVLKDATTTSLVFLDDDIMLEDKRLGRKVIVPVWFAKRIVAKIEDLQCEISRLNGVIYSLTP